EPAAQQQPQPQQPPPPPNPWQAPPSQTYPPPGYPTPGYPPPGYPPPGYGYGAPYYSANQTAYAYEAQKKSEGLALLLEFLIPGVGSIYGEHTTGALITWALMVAGIVLVVAGL